MGIRKTFADAWENTLTKLGTAYASLSWHQPVAAVFLTYEVLKSIYIDDSIGRRIINEPIDDGFAKGYELSPPEGLDKDRAQGEEQRIRAKLDEVEGIEKLMDALGWGRLHGRGALLLGTQDVKGDGDPEQPLPAPAPELLYLRVLDLEDFQAEHVASDTDSEYYGEPDRWRVNQETGSSQTVHTSRLILTGAVPTDRKTRRDNEWRDIPVLQSIYQDLRNYNSTKTSVAQMLVDASQAVLKVLRLPEVLADSGELFKDRMRILELARALHIMPISAGDGMGNGEEDFSFVERTFTGVGDAYDRIRGSLSSSAGWPETKMYGRSPAGENATGESDRAIWNDLVASLQRRDFQPALQRLVDIIVQGEGLTPGWTVEFPPQNQMSEAEKADVQKTVTETDAINIDRGVFSADQVATQRGGGDEPDFSPIMLTDDDKKALEAPEGIDKELEDGIASGPPVAEGEDIQKTAYNGAQVDKAVLIVEAVAQGRLPRDTGLGMLETLYRMEPAEALKVMGTVGDGFTTGENNAGQEGAEEEGERDADEGEDRQET